MLMKVARGERHNRLAIVSRRSFQISRFPRHLDSALQDQATAPSALALVVDSYGEEVADNYLFSLGNNARVEAVLDQALSEAVRSCPAIKEAAIRAQGLVAQNRENSAGLVRDLLALAAVGPAQGQNQDDFRQVQEEIASRLRAIGLNEEAAEVERQQLFDISGPDNQNLYRSYLLSDERQAAARCMPPDIVVFADDDMGQATRRYVFAHELAHKISFMHPDDDVNDDDDDSGWLMAEPFNDLRAIQLIEYNPGRMAASVDAGLEIAFGLSQAAGVPGQDFLKMSDSQAEERLAAGLGLTLAEWRDQVSDPFDRVVHRFHKDDHPGPVTTELLIAEMPPRIQQLIREYGPGFRHAVAENNW